MVDGGVYASKQSIYIHHLYVLYYCTRFFFTEHEFTEQSFGSMLPFFVFFFLYWNHYKMTSKFTIKWKALAVNIIEYKKYHKRNIKCFNEHTRSVLWVFYENLREHHVVHHTFPFKMITIHIIYQENCRIFHIQIFYLNNSKPINGYVDNFMNSYQLKTAIESNKSHTLLSI